jgi:hypothetical protein
MRIASDQSPTFLLAMMLLIGGQCNPVNSESVHEGQGPDSKAMMLTCPSVKEVEKREERKMTAAEEANFVSRRVRDYIHAQREMPSPGAIVAPPSEFSAVVDAGKDAVPFLLRLLSGNDDDMRKAAAQALARITNKSFVDSRVVFGAKQDPEGWKLAVAKYQEWWQQHRGTSRVEWLIEDTASPVPGQRRSAILQLRSYDTNESRNALRKCLGDPAVQIDAARSLAKLEDHTAIPVLFGVLLPDENPSIRKDGICLLIQLTGKSFDFDPDGTLGSRQSSIEKWKAWWQTEGKSQH